MIAFQERQPQPTSEFDRFSATTAMAFCSFSMARKITRSQSSIFRSIQHRRTVTTGSAVDNSPQRIVFLGTPRVAAKTLISLSKAAEESKSLPQPFEITAVVTQKPAPVGRKRVMTASAVHQTAEDLGIDPILTPETARDSHFLDTLVNLCPDLCITAAYGNFLPRKFLDIPRAGTVNIHPSLLPRFRGAAPVPRAIQEGVAETGVSVAFTELKLDSGPVIAQHHYKLSGNETGPELLETLFATGTDMLINSLQSILSGEAMKTAVLQNESDATEAPKLSKDEARITFVDNAVTVHNKIRAFAGWPGTWGDFEIHCSAGSKEQIRLKLLDSAVVRPEGGMCLGVHEVKLDESSKCLLVACDDGSMLALENVQPPGKNVMPARSFWNGLRGKSLTRKKVPY